MKYRDDPAWADVPKVAQDDGPAPIVSIAYSSEFKDVMDCFRGVLQLNEFSDRTLALTLDVIDANPANYTVWHFRRRALEALDADLREELRYTERMALRNPKNYQVWHHRRAVCERLGDGGDEKHFTAAALQDDAKNYHAWAHRQWAVRAFGLWDGELEFVDDMLDDDVRNNSAWNHRWFVLEHTTPLARADREREADYALARIQRAVHNESPWNYLRGLVRGHEAHFSSRLRHSLEATLASTPDCIFAAGLLVELLAVEGTTEAVAEATKLIETLMNETDPVRKPYWLLRKSMLKVTK